MNDKKFLKFWLNLWFKKNFNQITKNSKVGDKISFRTTVKYGKKMEGELYLNKNGFGISFWNKCCGFDEPQNEVWDISLI